MNDISRKVAARIAQITENVAPSDEDKEVSFLGIDLQVKAGVFDPSRGRSARKMASAIDLVPPKVSDRVIEVGIGAGGLCILMSRKYGITDITALDIMPQAITCAQENFMRHGISPTRLQVSDLFSAVTEEVFSGRSRKYDYVVFNAPTAHPLAPKGGKTEFALWDSSGNIKARFLEQMRQMTSDNSKTLIMYSKYADHNTLSGLDFSGFEQSFLHVSRDDISEAGVLLLTKSNLAL